jgi:RNA recognition motif-containing protein
MANPKRTLYVGGLTEEVNEKVLHAAFIPFGKHEFLYDFLYEICFLLR